MKEKIESNNPLETIECQNFAKYLRDLQAVGKIVKFTKTCQETFTRSWKQKNKNKAEGLESGLPDYYILFPQQAIWIEMKRVKGGQLSSSQKEWITALEKARQIVFVCNGCDEAIKVIERCL